MDREKQLTPLGLHSIGGCISGGFRLMSENAKTLTRRFGMLVLAFAFLAAACVWMVWNVLAGDSTPDKETVIGWLVVMGVLLLSCWLARLCFMTGCLDMLRLRLGSGQVKGLRLGLRLLAGETVVFLIPVAVAAVIALGGHLAFAGDGAGRTVAFVLTMVVAVGAMALVFASLFYCFMRYVTADGLSWSLTGELFMKSLRWVGFVAGALFVVFLIYAVIAFVLFLPISVLVLAVVEAAKGSTLGDEPVVPGYIGWLLPLLSMMAAVVMAYALMLFQHISLFVYGTVTARIETMSSMKESIGYDNGDAI